MRTTIRLNEGLLRQAKRHALESGRTLTAVIEDSLRTTLSRSRRLARKRRFRIVPFRGTGTCPGVNLIKTSELLAMDDFKEYRRASR